MSVLHAFETGILVGAVGIFAVKMIATKGWNGFKSWLATEVANVQSVVKDGVK